MYVCVHVRGGRRDGWDAQCTEPAHSCTCTPVTCAVYAYIGLDRGLDRGLYVVCTPVTCAVYASRSKPTNKPHTRAATATTKPQSYATTGVMREYGVYGPYTVLPVPVAAAAAVSVGLGSAADAAASRLPAARSTKELQGGEIGVRDEGGGVVSSREMCTHYARGVC